MFKDKYAEFEELGEDAVRLKLSQGLYSGRNLKAAESWLAKLDRERDHAKEVRTEKRERMRDRRAWFAIFVSIALSLISLLVSLFK